MTSLNAGTKTVGRKTRGDSPVDIVEQCMTDWSIRLNWNLKPKDQSTVHNILTGINAVKSNIHLRAGPAEQS